MQNPHPIQSAARDLLGWRSFDELAINDRDQHKGPKEARVVDHSISILKRCLVNVNHAFKRVSSVRTPSSIVRHSARLVIKHLTP